jgi:hypothetical protein
LEEFHYGWVRPNNDDAGSYSFKIECAALPPDAWEECERALQFFARTRPYLINYIVLDSYYGDLLKIPNALREKLGSNPSFLHRMIGVGIEIYALCDKGVNGFLSTGQSFRDRTLTKLNAGKDSQHQIRLSIADLETRHSVYRLLVQLRNLGLHNEMVFRAIPIKVDVETESYTVALQLDKSELLARLSSSKLKAVGDTSDIPDKIDFLDAARVYMDCHRTILAEVLKLQAEDLPFSLEFMKAVLSGARDTPQNAIPMIFRGIPERIKSGKLSLGESAEADVIEFPVREYLMLRQIFPEIAG